MFAMFALLCTDLALNSSLDYDNYDSNIQSAKNWLEWNGGVPSALLALQAIVQVGVLRVPVFLFPHKAPGSHIHISQPRTYPL